MTFAELVHDLPPMPDTGSTLRRVLLSEVDITPSFVLCIYGLDVDSETACSHHESRPTLGTEQANASLQSPDNYAPHWYEVDIEGLIEEIPQAPEGISDILTELE